MKKGDTVQIKSEYLDKGEPQAQFILLNNEEKGRVDIQLICDMPIRPIERLNFYMIEPAHAA